MANSSHQLKIGGFPWPRFMKTFTDIEQSKKLAEFLPLESADMYYFTIIRDYPYSQGKIKTIAKIMDGSFSSDYDTPCWSLAALLDILPTGKVLLHDKGNHGYKCICNNIDSYYFNNPVDACYEMILKLKEKNLL